MASNERVGITLDVLPGTFAGVTAALGGFNELVAATSMFSKAIADSTSVIDAMTLTLGVGLAGAAWESAKAFGELERGMKIVQAVSGQTSSQISILTQQANEFSVKYKLGIDDITAGLQTLGRAGLSNVNTQLDTMQAGLQAAKIQGMELNDALEKIVATTALLGGDLKSANFGQQAEKLTSQLLSTAMTAPIDLNDVVQTLSYSGGTAAAAGINIQNDDALYDYLGAISAFAQKGVKGSMAGTAMRAFFTKPASQDTSVVEAFDKLKMKPSDLWEDGGNAMRPVSEQIEIIHRQMEKLHMSTLDQIELWGKIVGPKMGQQMMKLNADTIKQTSREIRQTASATELAQMTMDNFLSDLSTLEQQAQRSWRGYGEAALAWISPIVKAVSGLFNLLGTDVGGIPIFQQFVKMGIIIVISQIIQKLGAVKNLFVGIVQEMRNMWGAMSKTERTVEEEVAAEKKRLQALGLTEDQAQALANAEGKIAGNLGTSNKVLAEFLAKLNQAVALMSELATLSRANSMNMISGISGAQFNRRYGTAGEGMSDGAWYKQHQGNMGHLTKNEFASLSLRHGMNTSDLIKMYDSKEFQKYAQSNQKGRYAFPTAVSLEKYLQENKKGLYDPKSNPLMGIVSNIKTDTDKIATNIGSQSRMDKSTKNTEKTSKNQANNQEQVETQKNIEEKKKQNAKEKENTNEKNKQNTLEKELTEIDEWCVQQAQAHANSISRGQTNTQKVVTEETNLANTKIKENIFANQTVAELEDKVSREAIINNILKKENLAHEQTVDIINQYNAELTELKTALSSHKRFRAGQGVSSNLYSMPSSIRGVYDDLMKTSGIKNLKKEDVIRAVNGDTENAKSQRVIEVLDKKILALEEDISYIEGRLPNLRREDREIRQSIELLENEKNVSLTKLDIARQQNQSKEQEYLSQQEVNSLYQEYIAYLNTQINKVSGQNGFGGTFTTRNANRRTGSTREIDKNIIVPQNARYLQDLRSQKGLVTDPTTSGDAKALQNAIKLHKAKTEEALEYVERELKELSEEVQAVSSNKIEKQRLVDQSKREKNIVESKIQELEQTKALLLEEKAAIQARIQRYKTRYDIEIFNATYAPNSRQASAAQRAIDTRTSPEFESLKSDLQVQKNKIKEVTDEISREKRELRQINIALQKDEPALQQAIEEDKAIANQKHQLKYTIIKNTELNNELSMLHNLEVSLEKEVLSAYDIELMTLQENITKHNERLNVMSNIVARSYTELSEKQEALNAMQATREILTQQNLSEQELAQLDKQIISTTNDIKSLKSRILTGETRINELIVERGIAEEELLRATQREGSIANQRANGLVGTSGVLNGAQLNAMKAIIGQTGLSPLAMPSGLSSSALATIHSVNGTTTTMYNKYGLSDDRVERLKHFGRLRAENIKGTVTPMVDPGPIKTTNEEYKQLQKNLNNVNQYYTQLDKVNRKNTSQTYKNLGLTRYSLGLGFGGTTVDDSVKKLQAQANAMAQKSLAGSGFWTTARNSFISGLAANPRYIQGGGKFYNWMQMGMTGMVDWKSVMQTNKGLSTLGKVSNIAGGALGSLGMMFGPFEVAMMGFSFLMQGIQAAQQRYKEELEKINSQLSEAREKFEKAEEEFLEAYEEGNPKATQEDKDEALLNLYANGPGNRDDGLDSYRMSVYGTLSQIEINTRKKAEKENDWIWGSRGAMQKHFWSPWDETWGWIFDDRKNVTRDEWNEQATIARENAAANDQDENEIYGITNHPYNDASVMEQYFKDAFHLEEIDKSLNHYENWVDDLEGYSEQAKYATSIMSQGVDATGPTHDSSWIRTFQGFSTEQIQAGIWGSKNGINDYRKFEDSLSKLPETVKTQVANSINQDPDFYKSMQRQMFTFSGGRLQNQGQKREETILEAIRRRVGNISAEQARQTLILSTISSINDFVQTQVQPAVLANVDAAMQGTQILGLTNTSVGYTGSSTAAVHQYVMVITSQLGQIVKQKALENASLLAESSGVRFEDLTKLAKEGVGAQGLSKTYTQQDADQAKQIFSSMGQSLYQGPMMTKGMKQEDAYKYAETKFKELNTTGSSLADMLHTWDQWFGFTMTPYIEEQWVNSLQDSTGSPSGPTGTGKDKNKDKDRDKDNTSANRKNWVNLAICNKKEIPKLNVNLFKKPPNFTILNRNFKLRDVNVNTADDAKSIQNAVKNSIIEIQNRSNPKIIQDDAAEYDPVSATDGNPIPTGTKKTE